MTDFSSYEFFFEEMGQPTQGRPVSVTIQERYNQRLPASIMKMWREHGFSAFQDGLLWFIDPAEYQPVTDAWLKDTPIENLNNYVPFARSAFGALYVYGSRNLSVVKINCPAGLIPCSRNKVLQEDPADPSDWMDAFLGMADFDKFDIDDADGNGLFSQALERYGPLAEDEIYAFERPVRQATGGEFSIENIIKTKAVPYLLKLRELEAPVLPFLDLSLDYDTIAAEIIEEVKAEKREQAERGL